MARVRSIVAALAAEGRTVVAISHDMRFVAETFERVVVMGAGGSSSTARRPRCSPSRPGPTLASTYLEPPLAARVGARPGVGSTPTEHGLVETLRHRSSGILPT